MSQQSLQFDPIDSPHPVPWNWVMATLLNTPASSDAPNRPPNHADGFPLYPMPATAPAASLVKIHSYRSPSLLSPDQQYAAYSRIQVHVRPHVIQSQVTSVLLIENLITGDLQAITPDAPVTHGLWIAGEEQVGSITMVMPVSWSVSGDRLLARTFASLFGTDLASDYAIIVDCPTNQVSTIAPHPLHITTAVLLGWSHDWPDHALFRAGTLGDPQWNLYAVDVDGYTEAAPGDRPLIFGQITSTASMGPHSEN
jgi:hypothetical protein